MLRIGLSIGVAVFPTDGDRRGTLSRNADAALYRAKAEGRGAIRFFEPEMDQQLRERRALQHDLRSPSTRDELALHYQPQATIGGEIIGFEALVRWQHPTRGLVPPDDVHSARGGERPDHADRRMGAARGLPRGGVLAAAVQVAVNLSPVQFRHGDLPALVHSILLETGLPPTGWSWRSPKAC